MHPDVAQRAFGEVCDLERPWASFCVAGAGNRARQLKLLDFVALCEKSAARARRLTERCEIMAGTGNPWVSGRKLGADASQNALAG